MNANFFQIAGVVSGPPCAHQKPGGRVAPPLPIPPRPPTIVGGPLPCLGVDTRGPSANSGSLRFLDLGDAGGPRDPYGPMGAPMASQLVRLETLAKKRIILHFVFSPVAPLQMWPRFRLTLVGPFQSKQNLWSSKNI